jgi:hypothetical protein
MLAAQLLTQLWAKPEALGRWKAMPPVVQILLVHPSSPFWNGSVSMFKGLPLCFTCIQDVVLRALSLLPHGCWHSVKRSLCRSNHWPGKIAGEKLLGEERLHQSFRMLCQTCCIFPQAQILTHRLLAVQAADRMDPAYAGHKSRGAHAEQGTSLDFPLLARCAELEAPVYIILEDTASLGASF